MTRRWVLAVGAAALWGVVACDETTPVSLDPDGMPVEARTVEIVLDWEQFAEGLRVFGGFGTPDQLNVGIVADDFEEVLDARTLARFTPFPFRASVRDTTGTTRQDSNFVFFAGRVVARFDTLASTNGDDPVELRLGRLTVPWHVQTASWTVALDTGGVRQLWPEAGAGPVTPIGTATWDPTVGDSVVFEVDSATLAALGDTLNPTRGVRLDLQAEGQKLIVNSVALRLDTRPNLNPDTVITLSAGTQGLTFIYDPVPPPPPDGIRIGGTPAWRTVIDFDMPTVLTGPASLCQAVGCPFVLEPRNLNHASLLLESRRVEPRAFQPEDTVLLDVRPVLAPERLPKSPLGSSFVGLAGRPVRPTVFGDSAGASIAIPVTSFVRALVDPESDDPPSSIALLSVLEPLTLSFASFVGPGMPGAPRLRLIVTTADTVEIR